MRDQQGTPRRPRLRVPAAAVALVGVIVFGVLSLAPALGTYLEQQRRIAAAEVRIEHQKAELTRVSAARARWKDPAYIRAQAGSRLFYVLPGTVAYRVVHASAGSSAPARAVAPLDPVWGDALVGSVAAAGESAR